MSTTLGYRTFRVLSATLLYSSSTVPHACKQSSGRYLVVDRELKLPRLLFHQRLALLKQFMSNQPLLNGPVVRNISDNYTESLSYAASSIKDD